MNALGYDAMTIGNHEPDFTAARLRELAAEARFPILAANVRDRKTGELFTKPYLIREIDGVKVGILGLAYPEHSPNDREEECRRAGVPRHPAGCARVRAEDAAGRRGDRDRAHSLRARRRHQAGEKRSRHRRHRRRPQPQSRGAGDQGGRDDDRPSRRAWLRSRPARSHRREWKNRSLREQTHPARSRQSRFRSGRRRS